MKGTKGSRKNAKVILEYINNNQKGVTFSEMKQDLKIVDSTLDRNLKLLLDEGRIVKNRAYYPVGANFAIPTFRMIMQGIEEEFKFFESKGEFKNEKKVGVLFDELFGAPGHPAPYNYAALPEDNDILTLEKLLDSLLDKNPESRYITGLSHFIASCFRYRSKDKKPKNVLINELSELEESLFKHDKITMLMEDGDQDKIFNSGWFSIYSVLYGKNGLDAKRIDDVLDRILKPVNSGGSQGKPVSNKDTVEDKETQEKLYNIKMAIRNVLWCEQLKNALYRKQFELFDKQFKSDNEQLIEFYGDLRRFAMEDTVPKKASRLARFVSKSLPDKKHERNIRS